LRLLLLHVRPLLLLLLLLLLLTLLLLLLLVSPNDGRHQALPFLRCGFDHNGPPLDSWRAYATLGITGVLWLEEWVQVGFRQASLAPEPHTCEEGLGKLDRHTNLCHNANTRHCLTRQSCGV
jgi:hypothetical protein